ncbi:MAG TPA: hypothetical protein VII11_04270 [Bacteroidota bacterium]
MFLRKPKYNRFEYLPRYYDPEKDVDETRRQKMRIERSHNRRKLKPWYFWGALFALIVYFYFYMAGVFR